MLPKGERARRARGRLPLPCGHTLYAVCKTLVRGEIRGLSPGPRCVRGDTFGLPSSPRRPVAQACMCGGHHGPWPPRCRAPAPRHVTCHLSHVTPSPDVAPSRAHRRRETTRIDPARQKWKGHKGVPVRTAHRRVRTAPVLGCRKHWFSRYGCGMARAAQFALSTGRRSGTNYYFTALVHGAGSFTKIE